MNKLPPIMTLEDVMLYETAASSFVMSFIYAKFPGYFVNRCKRKLRRLTEFSTHMAELNHHFQD